MGPNGESPFWKLRDWLFCKDNLFSSLAVVKVLDLFDLFVRVGNEKTLVWGEFDASVEFDRLVRFVTEEFADLSRNV